MGDERDKRRRAPADCELTVDESTVIELISPEALKAMLEGDERTIIEDLAESDVTGVVGRDAATGNVGVLKPESLDSLMNVDKPPPVRRKPRARRAGADFGFAPSAAEREQGAAAPAAPVDTDELQLVDTQMLRVMLDEERVARGEPPKYTVEDPPGGGKVIYDHAVKRRRRDTPPDDGGMNPYDSPGRSRRR
ncbi:MAG: hypothetical protein AAFX58_12385 [Pseudomonadota bacterium]